MLELLIVEDALVTEVTPGTIDPSTELCRLLTSILFTNFLFYRKSNKEEYISSDV